MAEMALLVAGVGTEVGGAVVQALQSRETARTEGKLAGMEGEVAADLALLEGAEREKAFRKKAEAQEGANIAAIGQSGVVMSGSPLEVMTNVAEEVEREAYGIRTGARMQAERELWKSSIAKDIYKMREKQAMVSGLFGAGGALMKGGTSIAGTINQNVGAGKSWWGGKKNG